MNLTKTEKSAFEKIGAAICEAKSASETKKANLKLVTAAIA